MFKILNVFIQDCCLVLCVEHRHADGSFWHIENYNCLGCEGLKHKRSVNARGEPLLDNGEVAPAALIHPETDGLPQYYLPEGRDWKREADIWIDEDSLLHVVRARHKWCVEHGFPQGYVDICSRLATDKITQSDRDGCDILLRKFEYLVGYEE